MTKSINHLIYGVFWSIVGLTIVLFGIVGPVHIIIVLGLVCCYIGGKHMRIGMDKKTDAIHEYIVCEYQVFMDHESHFSERMEERQKRGWMQCGGVHIKEATHKGSKYYSVAMKRIKDEKASR